MPPSHLTAAAKRWWGSIAREFELEDADVLRLTTAAEAWDRCAQARRALAKRGTTFTDRFGQPKPRPEVAIERDARIGFLRALRELGLDAVPTADQSRPPAIRPRGNLRIARS
jgi:P27 family predicted phage terminase small subunit